MGSVVLGSFIFLNLLPTTQLLTTAAQVLGSFIFLNLIVAVIIDCYSTLSDQNPNLASREDIQLFKETWARSRFHSPIST